MVDLWRTFGVFLLGSGAGAVITAAYYSSQIGELKRLIKSMSAQDLSAVNPQQDQEQLVKRENDEKRKSA
jgi:hypothetical protein